MMLTMSAWPAADFAAASCSWTSSAEISCIDSSGVRTASSPAPSASSAPPRRPALSLQRQVLLEGRDEGDMAALDSAISAMLLHAVVAEPLGHSQEVLRLHSDFVAGLGHSEEDTRSRPRVRCEKCVLAVWAWSSSRPRSLAAPPCPGRPDSARSRHRRSPRGSRSSLRSRARFGGRNCRTRASCGGARLRARARGFRPSGCPSGVSVSA